jgi:D-glycero-beta-D-manno-heptose 1-phosphate adenylyltransferase
VDPNPTQLTFAQDHFERSGVLRFRLGGKQSIAGINGSGVTVGEIIPIDQIESLGEDLRRQRKRIVFTNGHFDLLHTGHLRYLKQARELGDVLVVGVNDDAVTRSRKGPRRPIIPADERAELVAGLSCVDYAVIFHDETAHSVIERLRPDVYVKGGDYTLDRNAPGTPLPEASAVQSYGGEVRILPLTPSRSTSSIETRIVDLWRQFGQDPH